MTHLIEPTLFWNVLTSYCVSTLKSRELYTRVLYGYYTDGVKPVHMQDITTCFKAGM